MRVILFVFSVFLILSLAAQQSVADCPALVFNGEATGDHFGYSVAYAGDVNNDGFDDVIIGAPQYDNDTATDIGRAYVFSIITGETLYVFEGEAAGDQFGFSVAAAGDVDSNGYDDLIIGAPFSDNGRAYVFSGETGEKLHVFDGQGSNDKFGFSVSSAGDVDSNGYDDLIIGAPNNDGAGGNSGRAYVFSGKTGGLLQFFNGEAASNFFGSSVSSAGDVDSNSYNDVIVGAQGNNGNGTNAGRAYVYSGNTWNNLITLDGEASGDGLGISVASAGDVNSDGYGDIIVGAWGNDDNGSNSGRAYVFSGKNTDTLHIFSGEAFGDEFGSSVGTAGDVNNDGVSDLIIGAPWNDGNGSGSGRAFVFSGMTGDTLFVFTGEAAVDNFGFSVSSAGDVTGDGYDDMIIGAHKNDGAGTDAGRAYVYFPCGIRGDTNRDGADANILDLTYLVDFTFRGGPPAPCDKDADVNSDGTPSNILDLTFLVDFIFRGGSAPGPC